MSAKADTAGTADRIVSAASELFAERGYTATTTREIARRAGVNEVTVFRRFENKAGVLRALGERFATQTAGFVAPRLPHPDNVRDTLRALAQLEIEGAIRDGGVAMRLALDARTVPEVADVMGEGPRANQRGLAEYLAGRQEAGDLRRDIAPELMAEMFFALTSSLVMSRQLMGSAAAARELAAPVMIEQITEAYWSAVRAPSTDEEAFSE